MTTRALARPFTYAVGPDVGRGAVVQVRFGGARRRGVVVELGDEPPAGVDRGSRPSASSSRCRPPLVELALWLADYYGSTPARALALVAPPGRVPRGERAGAPALREALAGEAEPDAAVGRRRRAAVDRIVAAIDAGAAAPFLLYGATG